MIETEPFKHNVKPRDKHNNSKRPSGDNSNCKNNRDDNSNNKKRPDEHESSNGRSNNSMKGTEDTETLPTSGGTVRRVPRRRCAVALENMKRTTSITIASFLFGALLTIVSIRSFLAYAPHLTALRFVTWITASSGLGDEGRFWFGITTPPEATVVDAGILQLTLSKDGESLTIVRGQEKITLNTPKDCPWSDLKVSPDYTVAFMRGSEISPEKKMNAGFLQLRLPTTEQSLDSWSLTFIAESDITEKYPDHSLGLIRGVGRSGYRLIFDTFDNGKGPGLPAYYYPNEKRLEIIEP